MILFFFPEEIHSFETQTKMDWMDPLWEETIGRFHVYCIFHVKDVSWPDPLLENTLMRKDRVLLLLKAIEWNSKQDITVYLKIRQIWENIYEYITMKVYRIWKILLINASLNYQLCILLIEYFLANIPNIISDIALHTFCRIIIQFMTLFPKYRLLKQACVNSSFLTTYKYWWCWESSSQYTYKLSFLREQIKV